MTEPAEVLAAAVLGAQIKPVPPFTTGIVDSYTNATSGALLVNVSGISDDLLTCQSTGVFDLIFSAVGGAIAGLPVMVITIAGQPFVLTTYTIGV